MDPSSSLTNRRGITGVLPEFRLPPPLGPNGEVPMHNRYPAYSSSGSTQPPPPAQGHILTPPGGLNNEALSPLSSGNSGTSGNSAAGIPPYQQPMGYWPTPQAQNSNYPYSSAPPMSMPAPFSQQQQQQSYMARPMYSPSMNYANRSTNSPSAGGEGLPAPPYDISLPSFPTMSSGGGQQQHLPTLAPQQQQQAQHHQQQQQQQQHAQQHHQQQMMNSQQSSQAPPQGPIHAPDNYGGRPPPTPTYYHTPASTPQQASFPAYAQQSPSQQSPITTSAPPNRISPVSVQHPTMGPQGYHQRPYSGYSLPAMTGPIMSNVHSPGNQMALVGGMNMQYPQHQMGAPMYPHHPGQPPPQNDRPFKCDQCPQSFNRNHDLKRHKRIHLAVKPFPCGHCEKSFSRKDALKRHILVKGCGKSPTGANNAIGNSQSPKEGSAESPEIHKKDL